MHSPSIFSPRRAAARAVTGFTLIELMIVVAVVGILAAVAYPSYTDYVRRGRLPEAFSELSAAKAKMEQYFQDNRRYGTTAGGSTCGYTSPTSASKYFDFTCTASNTTFTFTATGKNGVSGHVYTINQAGAKATTQLKGSTVSATCWATKSASEC